MAVVSLLQVGVASAWVVAPQGAMQALSPGRFLPYLRAAQRRIPRRVAALPPRMGADAEVVEGELGEERVSALEHSPVRLVKRSPFQTAVSQDKVLQVTAWGKDVMNVPVQSITAFRFWPTNEAALVLLLMSNGQQKVVPLPLSEEVTELLQARLEDLEFNSPAAVAVRRLKAMSDGRALAAEASTKEQLSKAPDSASAFAEAGSSAMQQAPSPSTKQHFVVFGMDKKGSLELRMQNREAHLAFIRGQPAGRVQLGGPFLRAEDGGMYGSMLVVQGTRAEVEAMCAADPYVTSGLFESTRIEEWKWVVDAGKEGDAGAGENICVLECRDKPGALEVRKANREAHLAYLKKNGSMVLSAGPLLDEGGGMCGSIVILKGTEEEAKAFAKSDPYAAAGLFQDVATRRWKRVIDNRAAPES